METAASSACLACKQQKRKCNKLLPACGTCVRVGRECQYESGSNQASRTQKTIPGAPDPLNEHYAAFPIPSPGGIDPFQYASLGEATLDIFITKHALEVLGDAECMENTARRYFVTIFLRMPMISRTTFFAKLSTIYSNPRADFAVLCLCIHLIIQRPDKVESAGHRAQTMQSSTYIMIKSFIGILQTLPKPSLELVQAIVLMVFYEMGHGMYPAASISLAGCARAARALGLNKGEVDVQMNKPSAKVAAEQRRRVWWAIVNLDRFINLCTGDKMFATEDPRPIDSLPMELDEWQSEEYAEADGFSLSTPSDVRVGPFARECQTSHLVGRVVRHVFDPSSDTNFQKEEATQLERTLHSFLPLLMEQESQFGLFCAALGLCSSALFTLYDAALLSDNYDDDECQAISLSLESTSNRIAAFSSHLFADISKVDIDTMSPFVPYSLYQAAIVQYRLFKHTGLTEHKSNLSSLKMILTSFKKRWLVAAKQLDSLESLERDGSVRMLCMGGVSMSNRAIGSSFMSRVS